MSDYDHPSYPVTREGLENLRDELDQKVNVERPAMTARLHAAIQQGDLAENADYISAKEEQAFLEGRIKQLEEMIRWAVIIEESGSDTADLGNIVTIVEEGYEPETYTLVGPAEANPREGKISHESPMGQALMGHRVGDTMHVKTPAGERVVKIVAIT
jgi:transcription elongation factor GreA